MIKRILIKLLFLIFTLTINAQDKVFEKIRDKTWFEENGFAGESIVFIKSDSGKILAIRQVHGSGVPVVFTEVSDVEIHGDTIKLLNKPKNRYFMSYDQGIIGLRVLYKEPIIWVATEKGKILGTRINVNTVTRFSFEKDEVYIDDKVYIINNRQNN